MWTGIFRDLPREHGFEPLRVEGALPEELQGVLYRNGPARFSMGGEPYVHWFDGDGAVTAVRLGKGKAQGATRLVQTRWLKAEQAAGRRLYRNYAQLGAGWRRWFALPKNTANISVMPWKGQLLALWEAGLPIAMDPETLDTIGETNLDGAVGPTFSAHPHRVGDTWFNFGVHYGPSFSLDLYRLDSEVRRFASIPLPRPTIIHDFIATSRHIVFFCPPIRLKLAELLCGIGSFDQNLSWEPTHGTEVIVVPLAEPEKVQRFTVPAFFQWHFVNAWEEGEAIVVDFIPYHDFSTDQWFGRAPFEAPRPPPPSRYARARIEHARMDIEVLAELPCEFPTVRPDEAGRPHKTAWMLAFDPDLPGGGLPPALVGFTPAGQTLRVAPLGPQTFPSEPLVVPTASGEWVLSLVYDGTQDASFVAVIDANRPEAGPVARVWFDHAIPLTFHGVWAG